MTIKGGYYVKKRKVLFFLLFGRYLYLPLSPNNFLAWSAVANWLLELYHQHRHYGRLVFNYYFSDCFFILLLTASCQKNLKNNALDKALAHLTCRGFIILPF